MVNIGYPILHKLSGQATRLYSRHPPTYKDITDVHLRISQIFCVLEPDPLGDLSLHLPRHSATKNPIVTFFVESN